MATAITTSGRAVLFAGCTVVIALMGMFLMGLAFVDGLGVGAALAVLTTMIASVTLLPAMLGFIGPQHRSRSRCPASIAPRASAGRREGFWFRWSRRIQRRPWPFALGALAVLVVLMAPVTGLRLGNPDAGNDPAGTTTRVAYDLLAKGFGAGYNGPLIVAATLPHPSDMAVLRELDSALRAARTWRPSARSCPTTASIRAPRSSR